MNNGAAVTIGCGPIPWAGPGGRIGVTIGTIGIGTGTFGWKAPGSGGSGGSKLAIWLGIWLGIGLGIGVPCGSGGKGGGPPFGGPNTGGKGGGPPCIPGCMCIGMGICMGICMPANIGMLPNIGGAVAIGSLTPGMTTGAGGCPATRA